MRAFADYYDLHDLVQLNMAVTRVQLQGGVGSLEGEDSTAQGKWLVETQAMENHAGKVVPMEGAQPHQVGHQGRVGRYERLGWLKGL